jgi:hypothetical protein
VVEKIVWLRKHYHFGPNKIAMYLARYHDVTISTSGVWRILKRLGMGRLPASQRYQRRALRWKRYEKQRPGHQLQVDREGLPVVHEANKSVGLRNCNRSSHLGGRGLRNTNPTYSPIMVFVGIAIRR